MHVGTKGAGRWSAEDKVGAAWLALSWLASTLPLRTTTLARPWDGRPRPARRQHERLPGTAAAAQRLGDGTQQTCPPPWPLVDAWHVCGRCTELIHVSPPDERTRRRVNALIAGPLFGHRPPATAKRPTLSQRQKLLSTVTSLHAHFLMPRGLEAWREQSSLSSAATRSTSLHERFFFFFAILVGGGAGISSVMP
ncbi:hypothetical protein CDD83_2647 [Cordyceps sp. RAO-2017]|nr:hypothetical protein CDD83_2647 [Cordyceps sp. RAO-2017]